MAVVRFDDRFLEEIKARVRLSDVIGRSVKLRRQGREYAGLSPFSKEKTPSFFVNDDKGFWHDFSSGKHGDLIAFLQETERLSFTEAVERLAAEAGVPLPAPDPRAAQEARERQGLADWVEAAAAWFEAELRRPAGREARDYLTRRGLNEPEWCRFRIGYAPAERTRLKDYLVAKGARPAELVDAGLLIAPEDGAAPYDRFRERVIFPIADGRGRIISFGGRALNPEARAKYLNGPDTSLFDKSRTLYGLPEARRLLHAGGDGAALVVVEGYMDVIACQRAEIPAVAPMGTSLTEQQMEMLWRLHPEPTLAFDGDDAGRRAAGRAIDRALPLLKPGRSLRFAALTGGKDADDVLREQGAGALKTQLARTSPLVDELFKREREAAEPLDTPERRTALKVSLRKLAGLIADRDLSQDYRDHLMRLYEAQFQLTAPARTYSDAGRALSRRRWDQPRPLAGATAEGKAAARRLSTGLRPVAASVARAVVDHPELIDSQIDVLGVQGFGDEGLAGFARELIAFRLGAASGAGSAALRDHLARHAQDKVLAEIDRAADPGAPFFTGEHSAAELEQLWAQAFRLLIELAALERALQDAKLDAHFDFDAFKSLKTQRDAISRAVKSGAIWSAEPMGGVH